MPSGKQSRYKDPEPSLITVPQLTALLSPPAPAASLDAALVPLQLRVEGEVGDGVDGAVCPHAVLGRCVRERVIITQWSFV